MKYKKIVALGIGAIMIGASIFALGGCTQTPIVNGREIKTAEDVQTLMEQAKQAGVQEGVNSVDITADNEQVVSEAVEKALEEQQERDNAIIEDYKAELEALKQEQLETEAEEERLANRYESSDLSLNYNVASFTLDDYDVTKLQDTQIDFDGENVDIHEELRFSNDVGVRTSVHDEDFEDNVYLTLESANAIEYRYVFDDTVNIADVKYSEPLKINFLGKDLDIVEVTSSKFVARDGEKDIMSQGETRTYEIDGESVEVELTYVGDTDCKFKINGELTGLGEEEDVIDANGYEIYVEEIMEEEAGEITPDKVEFRLAKDILVDYETDEEIDNDERFEYTIELDGSNNIEYFGVIYVENSDSLNDEYAPITGDEQFVLPSDFLKIGLELTNVDYINYDFSFVEYKDVDSLRIDSSDDEGIVIGNDEVDRIYFNGTNVTYEDSNGDDIVALLGDVKLVNSDTELSLAYDGVNFTVGNIILTTDGNLKGLGTLEEAEATDIIYDGTGYGSQEEDLMTSTGVIIINPEDNADDDKVELSVPSETVEAKIIVE